YENALITANGDFVMLHGRFWNVGQPAHWVVADIVKDRRWSARRTLGCHPRRSHRRGVAKRAADVRRHLPHTGLTRNALGPQTFRLNDSARRGEDAARARPPLTTKM